MTRGAFGFLSTLPNLLVWAFIATLLMHCKPADEPQRRSADTAAQGGIEPSVNEVASGGTIRLTAPERPEPNLPVPNTPDAALDAPPQGTTPTNSSPKVDLETLTRAKRLGVDETLIQALLRPTSEDAKARAVEANRIGIKKHRKLDLKAAIQAYEVGLDAYPGHLFSRYNLACAKSLSGDTKSALKHLAALSLGPPEDARARLNAARVDPDFEALRDAPEFRALTRYAPVEVSWSPSVADPQAKVAIVDLLRRANIPAHEGREWRKDLDETTLYVAIDQVIAQGVADEVLQTKVIPAQRVNSRFLTAERPIVLVLGAEDKAPEPAVLSLETLIGKRLTSHHEGTQEEFLLKPTGFFVWTIREAGGTRVEKSGRYNLKGAALHLDFRVTTTLPGSPPDVKVEQGRRENYELKLDGGALMLGEARFTL